jgi:hypothetical protein
MARNINFRLFYEEKWENYFLENQYNEEKTKKGDAAWHNNLSSKSSSLSLS